MPVVHVRALPPDGGPVQVDDCLRRIAQEVAAVLDADPHGTWCTFTGLDRMSLGTEVVTGAGQIVFVDVWIRSRDPGLDGRVLTAACAAAAGALGVPIEDVWGTLHTVEPGAVFAGGGLVEE